MFHIVADGPRPPVCMMGLDPGSETLGTAILEVDPVTFEIVGSHAHTYWGSKLPGKNWIETEHSFRQRRIEAHYENLLFLFHHYQPIGIVCESPFFQMKRPQAYGALTEVVAMVRRAVQQYSPWHPLTLIDPPSIKNAVGAKGNAKKEEVQRNILLVPDLHYHGYPTLDRLDEHAIDALAAVYGYYHLKRKELWLPK